MDTTRPASLLYFRPALAFLLGTVAVGVWLRASLLHPALTLELPFRFMVHAHSHLAFYGWVTFALFAALLRELPVDELATSFFRVHVPLLTFATGASFVAFLLGGYGPAAIGLSVLVVALWMVFALRFARAALRHPWWRAALAYLAVAAIATFAPMVVLLRGASNGWWAELAIKLFLVPFINGWITLGVMAALAGAAAWRGGRAARWLVSVGALPSTLLFITAPPPTAVLLDVGRGGTALVALGSLAFAGGLWRARGICNAWTAIGTAALALKGTLELLAAADIAPMLMRHPQIVVAHLHLVLLGFVTAALLGAALQAGRIPARPVRTAALVFALGLAVMLTAIVTNGWAALFLWLGRTGLDLIDLLRLALLGGALAAAGVAATILPLLHPVPAPSAAPHASGAESKIGLL